MKRALDDPLLKRALTKRSKSSPKDPQRETGRDVFSFACCKSLLLAGDGDLDYHPLLETGRADIMRDPVFYNEADSIVTDYVCRKRHGTTASSSSTVSPQLPPLPLIRTMPHQMRVAFENDHLLQICDWMETVLVFLKSKNMKPEPFQIEIFAEALAFTAASLAPDHTDVAFKLIGHVLGKRPEQLHAYKGRHAAFIVMRRQGKTEWTQIMLAAALVSVRQFDMVYFAHIITQVNAVMDNIELYARQMGGGGGKLEYNKNDMEIRYIIDGGDGKLKSTVRGKSARNVNVSSSSISL